MSWLSSFINNPVQTVYDVADNVVDVVKDVGDFVQDDILIPVTEGFEDIYKAIEDDPVRSIAYIAAAVVSTVPGFWWVYPAVVAADTKESGGTIEESLTAGAKAAATQAVTTAIAAGVSSSVEAAVLGDAFAPTASAISTAETIGTIAGGAAVGATGAIILGEDPLEATIMGGAQAGLSAAMGKVRANVAEYTASQNLDLSDELAVSGQPLSADYEMPIVPKAILSVVEAQLAHTLSGGDGAVSDAVIQQAILRATVTTATMQEYLNTIDYQPSDAQLAALTNGVIQTTTTALQGGDVSATAVKNIINYTALTLKENFKDIAKTTIDKVKGTYEDVEKKAGEYDFVAAEHEAVQTDYTNAITEGNEAKEKYDALRAEIEPRFAEQARLKTEVDQAKIDFESSVANTGSTVESTALFNDLYDDSIKAYNAYTIELDKDYAENYKDKLEQYRNEATTAYEQAQDYVPQINDLTDRRTELGTEYKELEATLVQDADSLDEALKPTYKATDQAFVKAMTNDMFNAEEYARLNGLEDKGETGEEIDPYYHWLTTGKEEQLPVNESQYRNDFTTAANNLVNDALQAAGLTPAHLSKNTIDLIKKQINEDYSGNLAKINNADIDVFAKTISDQYVLEQEFNDDILFDREQTGKISSEALNSATKETIEYNKNNVTDTQIANGTAVLKYNHNDGLINWEDIGGLEMPRYDSKYGGMVVTRKGPNGVVQTVDLASGEVIDEEGLRITITRKNITLPVTADGTPLESPTKDDSQEEFDRKIAILNEQGTTVAIGSLEHLKFKNPEKYLEQVSILDADGGEAVNAAYSGVPVYELAKNVFSLAAETETGQDILNSSLVKNMSGIATQAGGELVQAANTMVMIAGINPASTPAGKWARDSIKLGGDMKTEEWKTEFKGMSDRINNANIESEFLEDGVTPNPKAGELKGGTLDRFLNTTKSIFGELIDHPTVFLAEYVGKEVLQEIPILIASGGTGNIAKRLMLEAGEAYAKKLSTKVSLGTALTLDAVESFGGTAAGAFDDAYATALKSGMNETEASAFAQDVAVRAGTTAVLTNFATNKIGGDAFEKVLYGGKKSGSFATKFNAFSKATIKEAGQEAFEETTAQGVVEMSLYPLDPNRDISGNLATNAWLGALAGGGTSTTLLAGKSVINSTGDFVSNIISNTNPQIKNIIDNYDGTSEGLTSAETQLNNLGIEDNTLKTNVLSIMSPSDYQNTGNVLDAFKNVEGVYTPKINEINQFVGKSSDTDFKSTFDAYIDKGTVNRQEILDAAAAENVDLTEDQINKFIGQKNEIETITGAKIEFDPLGTTGTEATDFFKAIGYNPTGTEITQFTAPVSELEQQEAIAKFVDPLMTDKDEVTAFYEAVGYTPSAGEIDQFVGQVEETKQKIAVGEYVDPRIVSEIEAFEAYKEAGLPDVRPEDVQSLTGQYDQELLSGKLTESLPGARYNVLDYNLGEQTKKVDALTELLSTSDTKIDSLNNLLLDQTSKTDALNTLLGTPATDTDTATGIYGTLADQQTNFNTQLDQQNTDFINLINQQEETRIATEAEKLEEARKASVEKAAKDKQMGDAEQIYAMTRPRTGSVKEVELANIGNPYDFQSIFRDAAQESFYQTPYRKGGQVDNINDRLLKLIGGN